MACQTSEPDDSFEGFRDLFERLLAAPDAERPPLIGELATHPWYTALQRRAFLRVAGRIEPDWLDEARACFAKRLKANPTLGTTPENRHLLPGFVRNHCRSIAGLIVRREARQARGRTEVDPDSVPVLSSPGDRLLLEELVGRMEEVLPEGDWFVAIFRWRLEWTLRETAAALGLTFAQVRRREEAARRTLRERLSAA